jgi:predicted membrane protein
MLFPFLLRHVPQTTLHTALPVLMLGAAGAMVHGIGFTPDHKLFRVLFGPATAWALVFVGAFWLLPG